jgi:excisionase family DNA binding protein
MTMTVIQASERLGVSRAMVYKLAAPHGPIPCTRIGSRVIFDESDVQDYKASCRVEHVPMPPLRLRINEARSRRPPGAPSLEEHFKRMGIKVGISKKRG